MKRKEVMIEDKIRVVGKERVKLLGEIKEMERKEQKLKEKIASLAKIKNNQTTIVNSII